MSIDSLNSLFFILAFIVPGFIFRFVYGKLVPIRYRNIEDSYLGFFTISMINYGIWSWLIYWIYQTEYFKENPFNTGLMWLCIIFISPFILGMLWGVLTQKNIITNALGLIGLNTINPIPTSWDYKFSRTDEAVWVIITLKDKSIIAGLWSSDSFSSSDPSERDIYLEKVYTIPDSGSWEPAGDNNDGVLISGDEIKTVEFFRSNEE